MDYHGQNVEGLTKCKKGVRQGERVKICQKRCNNVFKRPLKHFYSFHNFPLLRLNGLHVGSPNAMDWCRYEIKKNLKWKILYRVLVQKIIM